MKDSYTIHGTGTIWQLLCNLKPEKTYQIKQDGKLLFAAKAGNQGTLQFESSLSGKGSRFDFNVAE